MCMVSIVIPYFNNENTILRAMNSVFAQTFKDYEIILIDDGSKDKSKEIVEELIKENSNISIKSFSQPNSGPSCARNRGIKEGKGKYIAFLDADDEWLPSKLEKQVSMIESHNIDMLSCNYCIIKGNSYNRFYFTKEKLKKVSFRKLLFKHYFSTSCVLVKKDVLLKLGGFPDNQRYMEDALLFTMIAREYNAYITDDFLVNTYKYSYGESGLSGQLFRMEKSELFNFRRLRDENRNSDEKINLFLYISIVLFSIIKYLRRYVISVMR